MGSRTIPDQEGTEMHATRGEHRLRVGGSRTIPDQEGTEMKSAAEPRQGG